MSIDDQALAVEEIEAFAEDIENISTPHVKVPDYFGRRSIVTRALQLALFTLSIPLTAVLIVIVRCTSRGPGIYRQKRVGKDGKPFVMYKLRTMRYDAETLTGPVWAAENDPRLTRIGTLLRFLHLDELPQLWNVVRGDMNLIGPRPERPEFVDELIEVIPRYAERLVIKPGITGIAQINLPPDTDYESVARKLHLDLQYVETASALLDTRILLCSVLRMFGVRHGKAVSILRLHRRVPESALKLIRPEQREEDRFGQSLAASAVGSGGDFDRLRRRPK